MSVQPRPMRGVIQMDVVPADDQPATIQAHVETLLQEVGHQWLVPPDLKFRIGNQIRLLDDENSLIDRLNSGVRLVRPPLRGPQNLHWSPYLDAEASPFDGQPWGEIA